MNRRKILSDKKGAIAIVVGISSVVLLAFVGLVIDIGYGLVTRTELQNVADAAALAGARQLGRIYEGLTFDAQQKYLLTPSGGVVIIAEALDVAQKNKAGGKSISINNADIKIGQWSHQARSLTVTDATPDAVEVTARRDAAANGPISTFFARIMGINTFNVSTKATAALTGTRKVVPGEFDIPVGISKKRFESENFCGASIRFYPTNDWMGCAGWHTFFETPDDATTLRRIIRELINNKYQTPGATADETQFIFIGGNVASALPDFKTLYEARKDPNGNWKAFVVVYDHDDCSNPSGAITIAGFATAIITKVLAPPHGQLIEGTVACDVVETARGSGADYGTKGSIPGLVQ